MAANVIIYMKFDRSGKAIRDQPFDRKVHAGLFAAPSSRAQTRAASASRSADSAPTASAARHRQHWPLNAAWKMQTEEDAGRLAKVPTKPTGILNLDFLPRQGTHTLALAAAIPHTRRARR